MLIYVFLSYTEKSLYTNILYMNNLYIIKKKIGPNLD